MRAPNTHATRVQSDDDDDDEWLRRRRRQIRRKTITKKNTRSVHLCANAYECVCILRVCSEFGVLSERKPQGKTSTACFFAHFYFGFCVFFFRGVYTFKPRANTTQNTTTKLSFTSTRLTHANPPVFYPTHPSGTDQETPHQFRPKNTEINTTTHAPHTN